MEPYSVLKVVKLQGIQMITDHDELSTICKQVVKANPKQVEIFRKGKTKIIGFFVKQVMDATKNGADPKLTQKLLEPFVA